MGFDDAGLPPRDAEPGYVNNKHFRVGFRSFVVFLAPPGSFSALGFDEKKPGYVNIKHFRVGFRSCELTPPVMHTGDRKGLRKLRASCSDPFFGVVIYDVLLPGTSWTS